VNKITETKDIVGKEEEVENESKYMQELKNLLKKCYQCGRCSGVCQLSKVQKYPPSKIIQLILEGFEDKVLDSGILWECLTCNSCLQNCPMDINFADIVRIARYLMRKRTKKDPDDIIAHKGIYTSISELMRLPFVNPEREMEWVPKECRISDRGNLMYYVGCLPFFKFEFQGLDAIAVSTLKLLCGIEKEPIVVLNDEICCGHDLYWGQGKIEEFRDLARKNKANFEETGVSTIVTACAECYRTLKVDYPELFKDFSEKYEIKHMIEYIHENWKLGKIEFKKPNSNDLKERLTFHDPCRLSRFLPKENNILEKTRDIFKEFQKLGYKFNEMVHNQENALCCGVSSWTGCNEKSKALRYKRMLEAKAAGDIMLTSCPKCNIHLTCVQKDFEDLESVKIKDFTEFIVDHVIIKDLNINEGV